MQPTARSAFGRTDPRTQPALALEVGLDSFVLGICVVSLVCLCVSQELEEWEHG